MRFLSRMCSGEAHTRIGMKHARLREPSFRQLKDSGPIGPVLLAPAAECPAPETYHPCTKCLQPLHVSWYRVVVEVAPDDRLEPLTRLLDRIVHASAKLPLDFLQFGSHALGDGLALQGKFPPPVLSADVREAQEVECLWLSFPSLLPVSFGKKPELDPARLVWVEFQSKVLQLLPQVLQKTVCVLLVLKTQDRVVRIADDDHLAERLLPAPSVHPQGEKIMQGDISEEGGGHRGLRATRF